MAGTYDIEEQRVIDRIRCIAFREARDAGATFIDRNWIADKVHRSIRFITDWWQKSYDQCFADYSNAGRKLKLSQASQDIIREASGRQGKSCSVVAKKIAEKQKEYVTRRTINNYRHREGLKPFHVIPQPLKSETHISDRLWLCDWLKDWTEEDFLHLAPSDEFYVWVVRRPNYQNDRVWAKSVDDIEEDEHYREMVKNQPCIGIFVIFTAKRLHWVIKDKGESWTGQYFRDIILTEHVLPFLKNEENVIDPDEVIFIHDKAPCMRAYPTQHLLQDNDIKFWGNHIWPGNSPDLNVAEHIGTIIKDEVEKKMLSETRDSRYLEETLKMHLSDVLTNMETDSDLFETVLCSYPSRLRAVKNANGRHTDY
ncbi:unnamed protein product [Rotaria sordida]|uniref:Transposase n=1 Tax=Rotaria sordida TaxID=392033 RepID=A0A813SG95_9BILA|nr:unnamed protein product [Rotaria sordida]CAF0967019.1 unnamed protein product [Rotaria sordida]